MTKFERMMLVEDCRDSLKVNVLRTSDEAESVRERAWDACRKLGFFYPEDVLDYYGR